ncbi:uncharacterized protein LOC112604026 [Melanaphis sacchari]|uniref:uncharacterized protein LOC112604026 n=1 Tax=Melanaphis sacchari TaxID=742174 RepID=UPI000DC13920|nr:uncharacterized protein LOC112604026 [Melanaphis sacchari]
MKVTYSWLIYSCFIFGIGISCDKKLEKLQAESSCLKTTKNTFHCSNGSCIMRSSVCDGQKDCLNGSDENEELCAQYEYGMNKTTECGRVNTSGNPVSTINGEKALVGTAPWNVAIYESDDNNTEYFAICGGSIIAPNLVVTAAHCFWNEDSNNITINYESYKVAIGKYDRNFTVVDYEFTQIMNVETIYLHEDFTSVHSLYDHDIAVIVLSNIISLNNFVAPICIDWNGLYNVPNGAEGKIIGWGSKKNKTISSILFEYSLPFIDRNSCRNMYTSLFQYFLTVDKFCAGSVSVSRPVIADHRNSGAGLAFVHSNLYYLTGIKNLNEPNTEDNRIQVFIDVKQHVEWIRKLYVDNLNNNIKFCVLPTVEGVIYSYEDSDKKLAYGSLIIENRTVIENCDVGYYKVSSESYRVCQGNGKWLSTSEKLCIKMCPPLLSDSLDIKCTLNGKFANCSNPSIPDTIAIPSCKPTYFAPTGLENAPLELICQSNGMWDNQLYKCNPYCGKVYVYSQTMIANDEKALVGTAPWNVGIYRLNKKNTNYDLICGGSIIAPNLVISAAQCFWYKGILSKKITIYDESYKVAIGKYDRNLTVVDNEFTQIMNVKTIYLNEDYTGADGFKNYDIAVIALSKIITFNNFVAPICIDWNGLYNVPNGAEGKIVGWGNTENGILSRFLIESALPFIDQKSCKAMYSKGYQHYMTVDKFCAGTLSVSRIGSGVLSIGSGLAFEHSKLYYLTGIMNMKQPDKNDSVRVFIDIKHHVEWIRKLYIEYLNNDVKFCVLPTVEGVIYSYEGSDKKLADGTLIIQYRNVIENCDVGYHKVYSKSYRVCQGNGKWLSTSEKLCIKMCPPLLSDSLDIKCTLNGKFANCSNPSTPDTIAIPSCKPTYFAPIGLENTPLELICQSNGMWNNQLYKCNPYCGILYAYGQTLIANGEKAPVGTAPWNVGIYRLNNNNLKYDFICGGSIIAPNLVVSAAHCFWYNGILSNKITIYNESYKVAIGKYDINLTVVDNEFTQIMNVETIYLNEEYTGFQGFHAHDIAVIVLSNIVSFNNVVAPICIDWNGIYNVPNGVEGKIVGWGNTENGTLSPILLQTSLPYIDRNSCRNIYNSGFQLFVTDDKFCAGSTLVSGRNLGGGDSGSGLAFLHSHSYYLTGVLSLKEINSNNSIAVFTNIKHHEQWIRGLYYKHN